MSPLHVTESLLVWSSAVRTFTLFEALLGGLHISPIWSSKPVISCIEKEAMPLSVFYHCICVFLCHCRSFDPSLCHLSPFSLLLLMLLFQSHVACPNFILKGPLVWVNLKYKKFAVLVFWCSLTHSESNPAVSCTNVGFWALFPWDVVNNATFLAYRKLLLISVSTPPPPHLSALLVIGQSTNKQKKHYQLYPSPPDISPPLACLEMNSIFYDILKLKKLSKFKKYLITAILLVWKAFFSPVINSLRYKPFLSPFISPPKTSYEVV